MSRYYYVKCLGDKSYLKRAYVRTGPKFQGDVFTMNKAEAIKLTRSEAARLGYPEGDPVYKLIPCGPLTLNEALSAARNVLAEEDKETALAALYALSEAVSTTVEENREPVEAPFGGIAFDPNRKADLGVVIESTPTNNQKAATGKAVVALYYLLSQPELSYHKIQTRLREYANSVDLTQEPEHAIANMLTDVMHYCHRDEIELYGSGNPVATAQRQFNVESGGAAL